MSQHFLLTAAARTVSLKQVLRMEEAEAWAMFCSIRGPDVAANVTAVDLDMPPDTPEQQALDLRGHRLADLVGQHEGGLVLDVEIARRAALPLTSSQKITTAAR